MSTRDELATWLDKVSSTAFLNGARGRQLYTAQADALIAEGWRKKPSREEIVAELDPSRVEGRHSGRNHAGLVLHPKQAEAIADAILALMDKGQ